MNVIAAIKTRRSIRKYKARGISDDVIKQLIDLARLAPYGGDATECQLWEFIVVKDKETRKKMMHGDEERKMLIDAPVVIAVCVDTSKDSEYRGYFITAGLAAENLLLAAHSLGLGACFVDTYSNHIEKNHQERNKTMSGILNLPEHVKLIGLIAIGYPDEIPKKKELRNLDEMIHYEKW